VSEETVVTLPVPEVALWAILGVTVAVFLIVSAVMHHHWSYYGVKESDRQVYSALYYVVAGLLLLGMALAALAYGAFKP
jgi:hypothetical protein